MHLVCPAKSSSHESKLKRALEIVVTTDSKDTLEDLVAYSNKSDSSIDINVVENDKGWEVRLEIGGADQVTLPHSNESSVPEDAVS